MYRDLIILLFEDNQNYIANLMAMLAETEYFSAKVIVRSSIAPESIVHNNVNSVAVVLFGLELDDIGDKMLAQVITCYQESAIIVLADVLDDHRGIQALQEGAQNYLAKDKLNAQVLGRAIRFSMERNSNLLKLKNANAALQLSEQRFSRLFHNNPLVALAVSTLDEGRFVQVNEIFLNIFGLTREQVVGKTARELNTWVNADQRDGFISRIRRGEAIKNVEVKVRTKEGNIKDLLFSMDVIEMDNGPMIITVADNITDHLEALRKLKQSENSLDTLINSSSDPIWLVDNEFRLIIWNRTFYEFIKKVSNYDISAGDLIYEALPNEIVKEKWKKYYGRAVKGENFTIENSGYDEQLGTIYNELTFNPAYDENGKLVGIGCFSKDMTIRKNAERKLAESEFRYRSLVEQASDSIFIANEHGQYTDVNTRACELLGYTREELLQMSGKDILYVEESVKLLPKRYEALKDGKSYITENKLKRKDGTVVEVETSAWKLPDGRFVGIVRNITERKNAERSEAEMQQRLKAIFNSTNDAILLADDSKKIVQVNPAAAEMFGYTVDELFSMTISDLVTERSETLEWWNEFLLDGRQMNTIELTRKGGARIICHYNATANILPGLHLTILTDITESKRAEDIIRKSESSLAEAQKLAQYGNWDFDILTGRLSWSEELYRIFGKNKKTFDETHGSFLHLVNEDDRAMVLLTSDLARKEGNSFDIEYRITTGAGDERVINELGYAERDREGNIIRLFGTAQNITARKKAEEAVRVSEKQYRFLFENNPMPMWVIDSNTLEFFDVNKAALIHYGYNREEFLSMSSVDIKSAEEKKRYRDFKYVITNQPFNAGIWKHVKKDRTVIDVEIIFHDINFGERAACLVIVNDLTEKLKAEAEIKSSYQKLQDLTGHLQRIREEERTRIAREIHDELGQQLTGLKMDASWVVKKIQNEESVRQKMMNMISLIDETVKTVRRISSELRPGILDDLGLIPAIEWQGQEFEKRTGIKLRFITDLVDLNPERNLSTNIFRVYQETLTNVARHAQATEIETRLEEKNDCLYLTIKDNGLGFDMEEAKNKNSLGLIGMKERALMFKGLLTIESAMNKGTVITLKIPNN